MEKPRVPADAKPSLKDKMAQLMEERKAKRQASVPIAASLRDSRPSTAQSPAAVVPQLHPPKLVSSLIAEDQSRRSPSAVPAVEPAEIVTQKEMNTSERYGTLLPQSESNGLRKGSVSGPTLSRQQSKVQDPPTSNSYVIPISLLGHQRDQYTSMTEQDSKVIDLFLTTLTPDDLLTRDAEQLLEKKRQVALHPDLVDGETMTPYADVRPEQVAQWYTDCCAKFRFIKELFDGIRDQTIHIAVVAQPGIILDMLEKFLSGITVPHRRMRDSGMASLASEDQGLMVTIVSADDEVQQSQLSPAELVVALDPTVSAECMAIKALTHGGTRAVLATLVVPYSVEHLEQSISTALPDHKRLRMLMTGFDDHRHEVGKPVEGQLALKSAAQALGEYLAAQDLDKEWPLATLAPLEMMDSQTESDIDPPATQNEQGQELIAGMKRHPDTAGMVADEGGLRKKARHEPPVPPAGTNDLPVTINPQDLDITHISDSVTKPTQGGSADATVAPGLLQNETERSLHRLLQDTQSRLDEHTQSLGQVQFQYEELRQQLVNSKRAGENALVAAQALQKRTTKAEDKLFDLRVQHAQVAQQLADAHARLLNHSVPERAEIEQYRAQAEAAELAKASAETRLGHLNKDHEYLRDVYQNSTQGAESLASQVTDLENSLAVAQNKATGEHARLRQMGYDAQDKMLRNENKKLKAMLKDRDAALKFRDDEIARLKEASRGRMGTRATSVPRSPRLGSPMKVVDGPLLGRASRQGSPSAGDLRMKGLAHLHPLRNG